MDDPEGPKLLPARIDWHARRTPSKPFASVPNDDQDIQQGYHDVTYSMFASAVDEAAHWLDAVLDKSDFDKSEHCFTYCGPTDLRWLILFVAAVKTQRKILMTAIVWNSTEILQMLHRATKCIVMLHANTHQSHAMAQQAVTAGSIAATQQVPELDKWLSASSKRRYQYALECDAVADKVVAVFHTSGTTGTPKPLYYTNRIINYWLLFRRLHDADHRIQLAAPVGCRLHCTFQISYGGGIYWNLFLTVTSDTVPVFPPAMSEASSLETAKQVLQHSDMNACAYTPASLSALVSDPEGLRRLRSGKIKSVSIGGAALDNETARKLTENNGPNLYHCYGSLETQMQLSMRLEGHEWPYFSFHPYGGQTMVPISDSDQEAGLYECVIKRDPRFTDYRPVFSLRLELDEYHTNDLFSPHPTKPDMWRLRGRVDDVVTLRSSQNIHTADMQRAIEAHPSVSAALVGGRGMLRPFLLVELHPGELERFEYDEAKVKQAIWENVEDANRQSGALEHAHIKKDAVLITRRPFKKTGKGNVDRKNTLAAFEDDVRAVSSSWK